MIAKILLTVDIDPETKEVVVLKSELQKEKVSTPKKKSTVEETSEPQLTLEANKYILNQAAADLMGVKWEDRLDIQYQKVEGITFPVIGTNAAFGSNGGNKLTKSLTVSCRGKANELLSKYGDVFTITKMKNQDDLFVLVGNTEQPNEPEDENIEIKEDENPIDLSVDDDIILGDQEDTNELEDPFEFEI